MSYIVKRFDYGRPRGTVFGPTPDRQEAIHKAERFAEDHAEGSLVSAKPFKETPGDAWDIEGYAKHSMTAFNVYEVDDV